MHSTHIARNVLYNLAGVLVPLLATVLTLPPYLNHMGAAKYGILSLIWLLFGYFGLFDFGLSRATANRLAKLRGADPQDKATVFYTAVSLNLCLGTIMGIMFFFLSPIIIGQIFGTSALVDSEVPAAVHWLSIMFPLAMVGGVFVGSIEAEERFFAINLQQIVGAVLMQCFPLLFVLIWGNQLKFAVIGAVVARLISVTWIGTSALYSLKYFGVPPFNFKIGAELFKYGSWIAVTNLISPIMESADRVLIGYLLGPQAIAQYSIPSSLTMKTLTIPAALSRTLFPRFSGLSNAKAFALASEVSLILGSIMAMVCAPGILVADTALNWWLGSQQAGSMGTIAQILLIGTWANGMAFIPFALLQSQGRPDIVGKFHALELVPFLVILGAGVFFFGINGAAAAWSLRVIFDAFLLFLVSGSIIQTLSGARIPLLLMLISLLIATFLHPVGIAAIGFGALVFFITLGNLLHSNATFRRRVMAFRF